MSLLHIKSYDQIQKDAQLVACSRCASWYYATHPKSPEVCAVCRDQAWVKSIAEPGEKVTR